MVCGRADGWPDRPPTGSASGSGPGPYRRLSEAPRGDIQSGVVPQRRVTRSPVIDVHGVAAASSWTCEVGNCDQLTTHPHNIGRPSASPSSGNTGTAPLPAVVTIPGQQSGTRDGNALPSSGGVSVDAEDLRCQNAELGNPHPAQRSSPTPTHDLGEDSIRTLRAPGRNVDSAWHRKTTCSGKYARSTLHVVVASLWFVGASAIMVVGTRRARDRAHRRSGLSCSLSRVTSLRIATALAGEASDRFHERA